MTSKASSFVALAVVALACTLPTAEVAAQFTATGVDSATAIDMGAFHSCALLQDGTVRCWGNNNSGQLGDGTTVDSPTPVAVTGMTGAAAVSGGGFHTCASFPDGTLQCWGRNNAGQLGDPATLRQVATAPVPVTGITTAVAVTAGAFHTCALLGDGTVWCWGQNDFGQLGNGTSDPPGSPSTFNPTPVTVTGITTAVAISATGWHTCALLQDGTLRCWGDNTYGQLGDGATISPPAIHISSTPVTVSGITTADSIDAGIFHTCAVLRDGTARCWGRDEEGRLGNGSRVSSSTPTTVTPTTVPGFAPAALGAGAEQTCALLQDGRVSCWGDNTWGELGNETPPDPPMCCSTTPARPATGITTAVAISSGVEHTCALLHGGTVSCWGNNNFGRLGVPITDSRTRLCPSSPSCAFAPVPVNGIFRSVFTLTVTVNDVGSSSRSGTVTSSPDGITGCSTSCSASFDSLTRVTLTTEPDPKSVFAGWSGCDAVSGTTCTVTMNAARSVTATYDKKPRRSPSFSRTGETATE